MATAVGPAAAYAEGQEVVFRLFDDGERVGTVEAVHRAAGGAVTAYTVATRHPRLGYCVQAADMVQAASGAGATAGATQARKLTNRRMWQALASGAASPEAAEVLRLGAERLQEGLDYYLAPRCAR